MKAIIIKNKQGEKLKGVLYSSKGNTGLIIICHGFGGSRKSDFIKNLTSGLKIKNYDTFSFDFSGNGESEGVFGEAGLIKEKSDLICIINHFRKYKKIILIGYSMGGAVVITSGRSSKRIKGVCVINPLVLPTITFKDSILKFRTALKINKQDKKRFLENLHKSHKKSKFEITKKVLKKTEQAFENIIDRAMLRESFFKQAKKVDVTDYAENLKKPILIIHGEKDEIIPLSHAEYLLNQAKNPRKLITFDYTHYPASNHQKKIIGSIKEWLKNFEPNN